MATIANLSAKISADSLQFEKKTGKVLGLLKRLQSAGSVKMNVGETVDKAQGLSSALSQLTHIDSVGNGLIDTFRGMFAQFASLGKLGPIAATAAIALAGVTLVLGALFLAAHIAQKGFEQLIDDLHIARQIGTDVSAIEELRTALRAIGGDTKIAGKALLDLTHTLSAGIAGDIPINDALRRIGLSSTDLARMRPEQALRTIAEAMKNLRSPSEQAAIAQQLFGENAKALLPILVRGRAALDEANAAMQKFGTGASNIDATNLESLKIMVEQLAATIQNVLVRAALELVPVFVLVGDVVSKMLNDTSGIAYVLMPILGIFVNLATVVRACIYVMLQLGAAMDVSLKAIQVAVNLIISALLKVAEVALRSTAVVERLAARVLIGAAKRAALETAKDLDNWADAIAGGRKAIADENRGLLIDMGNAFKDVDNIFAAFLQNALRFANNANKIRAPEAGLMLGKFSAQFEEAKGVISETATPLEKFQSRMMQIEMLLAHGAISWETYTRATSKAVAELEAAHELVNLSLPSALKANTIEAASAINKAQMQEQQRFRETPQDRVRRVLEQSQEIEKQILEQNKRIAEGFERQNVVRF